MSLWVKYLAGYIQIICFVVSKHCILVTNNHGHLSVTQLPIWDYYTAILAWQRLTTSYPDVLQKSWILISQFCTALKVEALIWERTTIPSVKSLCYVFICKGTIQTNILAYTEKSASKNFKNTKMPSIAVYNHKTRLHHCPSELFIPLKCFL